MSDKRLTPANARVAAAHLKGVVPAPRYAKGTPHQVTAPVLDLCSAPDGPRVRQVLLGARLTSFEVHAGWHFVQAEADGYCGYVRGSDASLGAAIEVSHRVASFGTHAYAEEDFKSPVQQALPFDARVQVLNERAKFFETNQGFIPKKHLRPLTRPFVDPVTIAQLHFQVPYLWGGNSTQGIDCSGLVQAALTACDLPCPGDSDMQRATLGIAATGDYQRGDLVFWQGHVGMMVDADVMIHANAHHMAVAYEPIKDATLRIAAQGDGPVLAHKRLPLSFE